MFEVAEGRLFPARTRQSRFLGAKPGADIENGATKGMVRLVFDRNFLDLDRDRGAIGLLDLGLHVIRPFPGDPFSVSGHPLAVSLGKRFQPVPSQKILSGASEKPASQGVRIDKAPVHQQVDSHHGLIEDRLQELATRLDLPRIPLFL